MEPEVMVHMIYVQFPNHIRSVMFFDDKSSCSIITHKLAGFLGIKGRKVVWWIEVAGRDFERHETLLYELELGNIYPFSLLGIEKIASNPGSIDVEEQEEVQMLKDFITYNQENQCVRVTYPTIGDMTRLKNNQLAAMYEKRLIKIGKMENYNSATKNCNT